MSGVVERWARDTARAAVGVAGAFAGMKAIEVLRPPVIAGDATAPENDVGMRELPRAYFFSAGAVVAAPALGGPTLPRVCGPLGLLLEVASVGLRVWAMRTLQGHYAHTLRVVDDQPVIRDGPYRYVRHPGYLSVVLLWFGAALSSRTVVAPALTLTAVGTAYRHRMDAEDALLRRELPGYAEYAATTGRLVPRPGGR
ncbi:methyltransferase family protein [Actinomycetospora atypica]|uniref:Methyltransferase family protein n=1 Tax=Actinomycetospora atypica TaxID=1290095 RepID=A0ABV9YQL1_9PSEU